MWMCVGVPVVVSAVRMGGGGVVVVLLVLPLVCEYLVLSCPWLAVMLLVLPLSYDCLVSPYLECIPSLHFRLVLLDCFLWLLGSGYF